MSKNSDLERRALTLFLSTFALGGYAGAAQVFTYGVDAGVGETDNVTLAPNDKVSQTMAIADLDFALKEQTRLLDVNAKGDFSYLDYLQNAYGSQLIGRFDGLGRFAIIPERLTWSVQDNFGQSALDPFTPMTPNNLENVNYFSTGPDLNLRLGGTGFISMTARYARASYQTSPYNSNRLIGSVAGGELLSANSSISLNVDDERVLFTDTTLSADFNRTNVFVDYTLQGLRTSVTADLGASRVDQSGTTLNGSYARLQVERVISQASKLNLAAGRDLTDASASFSGLQGGATGVVGSAPAAQTAASYTNTYVTAGWQYERHRTLFGVSGRWERNEYDGLPLLDYHREGGEARVVRKLTHAITAELDGRIYKTQYPNIALVGSGGSADYTESTVAASLTWRYGRGLEIKLRGEHSSRVTPGVDDGYRENRAFLTIGYRPRPADLAQSESDTEEQTAPKAPARTNRS